MRSPMIRSLFIVAFSLAINNASFAQDTVILINGETITGKIVEDDGQRIVVDIPYGSIRIPSTDIARIIKEQPPIKRPQTIPLPERAATPAPPPPERKGADQGRPLVTPSTSESGNIVRAVDACLKEYAAKRIPADEFPATLAHIGDEAIPYLLSLLNNKSYAHLQEPLILALGRLKARSALTAISSFAKSPSTAIRKAAVISLSEIGGRDVVAPLLAALKDKDGATANVAIDSLSYLSTTDQEIARWVVSASHDLCASGEAIVRARTACLLGKIEGEESFSLLVKIAREDRGIVQCAAIRALASINTAQSKSIIVECLTASDDEAKIEACKSISFLKTKDAIPQLIELLNDPNPDVSDAAYQTLLAISSGRSVKDYQSWKQWWQYISTKQ